jgi:hypothetical protein
VTVCPQCLREKLAPIPATASLTMLIRAALDGDIDDAWTAWGLADRIVSIVEEEGWTAPDASPPREAPKPPFTTDQLRYLDEWLAKRWQDATFYGDCP